MVLLYLHIFTQWYIIFILICMLKSKRGPLWAHKNAFKKSVGRRGSALDPAGGAYSAFQVP